MATYSIELRNIINAFGRDEVKKWFMDYNLEDYLTAEEIGVITARGTWNKEQLADRILDHYFMREIGLETPSLFKHQVKVAMQEIMEEKLPLIYSASIKYDPLINVDFTETLDRNTSDIASANSTSTTTGLNVASDTPQGNINKASILNGSYATNTDANENESSDSSASNNRGTEYYTKTTRGNSGVSATAQKMVQQYRENIRMINREIIDDLSELFMMIY